uniref:tRNA-splicing endonuclease subunit Sen54 N-terminal domain-containing protein n=1 Tax=Romanomermis culicivorax TaxID=13658 RepID=A0A915K8L1_ROMCU
MKEAIEIFGLSVGQKLSSDAPVLKLSAKEASLIDQLYYRLRIRKVARKSDLCRIDFDCSTGEPKVVRHATKVHRNMGSSVKEGTTVLYPEEALFLLDAGVAEIYCNGYPSGFNELLSKFTSFESFSLERYAVYATLFRSGYIVRRPSTKNMLTYTTNLEKPMLGGTRIYASNNQLFSEADELSSDCQDILPSIWCMEEIFVPDDHGFKNIFLFNIKPTLLPFEYEDNVPRFVWYRDFSRNLSKNATSSIVDEKRRLEQNDFYKKHNCIQLNAAHINTWAEYKLKKRKMLHKCNRQKSKPLKLDGDDDIFQPLANSSDMGPDSILERLSVIESDKPDRDDLSIFVLMFRKPVSNIDAFRPDFDVYLPQSGFKLSAPTPPNRRIIVKSVQDFCLIPKRIESCDSIATFAMVADADISYFAFQRGSVLNPLI